MMYNTSISILSTNSFDYYVSIYVKKIDIFFCFGLNKLKIFFERYFVKHFLKNFIINNKAKKLILVLF